MALLLNTYNQPMVVLQSNAILMLFLPPIGDVVSDESVMWSQDSWCLQQALCNSCCICSTDVTAASLLVLLLNKAGVDVWYLEQALCYSCCICSSDSTVVSLLLLSLIHI